MTDFLPAEKLGLTEEERCALVKVLAGLQSGELEGHTDKTLQEIYKNKDDKKIFYMGDWGHRYACGTVACIAGWAGHFMGEPIGQSRLKTKAAGSSTPEGYALYRLFVPPVTGDITPEQASRALINYLTSGKPDWDKAMKGD